MERHNIYTEKQSSFEYLNVLLMALFFMPLLQGLFGDVECLGRYVERLYVHYLPAKQSQSTGPLFTTETPAFIFTKIIGFISKYCVIFFCDVPNNADHHNISNNTKTPYSLEQSPSLEANRSAASHEIPHILLNPKFITTFTSAHQLSLS